MAIAYQAAPSDPSAYQNLFNAASRGLGQLDAPPGFVTEKVNALKDAFVNEYKRRTGQTPPGEEIDRFVADNLDENTVTEMIRGGVGTPQIGSLVRNAFDVKPELAGTNVSTGPVPGELLQSQNIQDIFKGVGQAEAQRIEEELARQANPARKRIIEEESALGSRLTSPVSRARLGEFDVATEQTRAGALRDLFGGLSQQQAQAELDRVKLLEDIFGGERRAGEQVRQFGQGLGLEDKKLRAETGLAKQELDLKKLLGLADLEEQRKKREEARPGGFERFGQVSSGFKDIGQGIGALRE